MGAVGGTTAGGLLHAGHRVILVDPWYENVEAIRRRGLAVTVDGARHELPAQALYPDELGSLERANAQVILLACKSYDTVSTLRALEPYLAPDGVVVSLQNGINEDRIAELVGADRTVGCVVHYNGGMLDTAHAFRLSPSSWHSYTVGELDVFRRGRAARGGRRAALGGRRRRDDERTSTARCGRSWPSTAWSTR